MTTSGPALHTEALDTADARQRLALLHGLYGRGRNWQAIAREVIAARHDWSALLVDLRLHGESPAFDPPHTVEAAAQDVRALIAGEQADEDAAPPLRALLGHSFGGKVALAVAAAPPDALRQVWVIDASPGTHAPDGSALETLTHLRSLPQTFAARGDLVAGLERLGWPTGIASFMATNLRYADGLYRWALDFDAIEALLHSYFTTDLWHVLESPPAGLDIHVVKAELSSTLNDAACTRIERASAANGRVHLHRLAGGHWLNTDNPRGLIDLLTRLLPGSD